jgi:hypothetical protein
MTKITTELSLRRLAVLAAIGLVACSGPGDTPRGGNAPTPGAAEAPETNAKEVATSFLEAYGAFDADRAITYLADDADLSGLGAEGTRQFGLLVSFLEAQGYKQMLAPCEETGNSSAGTYVRCAFDFHAIRSDEIGRGPFSGSYFDLTVRDGQIVRVSNYFETEEFSPQMWEPFAEWVSSTYPGDAAVMYNEDLTDYQLSEESIALWNTHSRGYVKTKL